MAMIIPIRGSREAPKSVRSKMETIIFTAKEIMAWKVPPFQRPVRINDKVRAAAAELKENGGVITGVLTLGKISGKPEIYIVDGQHRLEAFKISVLAETIADVRMCEFDTMGEMGDEFVRLNSNLVRMRPDDLLRGMEQMIPGLVKVRQACSFVGYDQIRRNAASSPIVGMSSLLRCWQGSSGETPTANACGSSTHIAQALDNVSAENLINFLSTAYAAWGREESYFRLWSSLNLTMCMWLWRQLVLNRERGLKRYVVLDIMEFKKCLMSVSATTDYIDWLTGRALTDRDRAPCYSRLKSIFSRRTTEERGGKEQTKMPQPPWAG